MEEKKFQKRHSSFWPLHGFGSHYQSFLGKLNISPSSSFFRTLKPKKGFTLIELLVAIMILSVMIIVAISFLNPLQQIRKSQDAQREQNLKQLNSALDTFYNDTNCYPQPTQMPLSGNPLKSDKGPVYIQKIPVDPSVSNNWQNYAYVTDTMNQCPQWNVLFAKIAGQEGGVATVNTCPLMGMEDSSGHSCIPQNFNQADSKYNYCVISGNIDCNIVESLDASGGIVGLGVVEGGTSGGGGVTPVNTPTPTPGGYVCPCADTISHAYTGQGCQGGGWSASGFDHSIYQFYCSNDIDGNGYCGGPGNPPATDCR